ncbi:mitochondrial translation release factor in rescue [Culicoides brevitarsis]|uniref:mitochondrial translation release factor in rescue n=1 Tax=Culicoides brevitarsis TaxID=469753 RepID=UPI00307BD7ED
MFRNLLKTSFSINNRLQLCRFKATIDYSKFPKINEEDLEERFVRGSGPGGQAVNKTANNVVLKHIPTGIIVKCHKSRLVEENRKEARKLLAIKLDNEINGENSVEAQTRKVEAKKMNEADRRRRKLQEMKQKWKERENIE